MFIRTDRPIRTILAATGLALATALAACETAPWSRDDNANRYPRQTTARTTDAGQPADEQQDWSTQTLAFPTGNRADSVILLEKRGPAQVRVGQPIEYQITVTNISDQPLDQVVVHDRLPQRFLAHREQELAPGQPGQDVFLYFADPAGAQDQPQPPTSGQEMQEFGTGDAQSARPRTTGDAAALEPGSGVRTIRVTPQQQQQNGDQTLQIQSAPPQQPQPMRPLDRSTQPSEAVRQVPAQDRSLIALTDVGQLASAQGNAGQWFIGSLAPGESRTITLNGYADAPGTLQSCTTVSYQPTVCFATEVTQPLLRVERQLPSEVNACEPFEIRYRVTNVGTGPASNVVIREQLPEGLVQARRESGQSQAQAQGQAGPIELSAPGLRQGQSREFTVLAQANRGGQFTTQALAVDDQGNQVQSEASQITVRQATLQLAMEAPQQSFLGRAIPLRLTLTNNGDAPAREVRVEQQVPAGARVVQADRAQAQDDRVVWQIGTLQPGQSITLNSSLSLGQQGQVNVQAFADGLCVADAATATGQTAVVGLAAILLEVVDTQDPVQVGQQEQYVIRVTNQGTVADTNIQVQVTLPPAMAFVSANPPAQAQGMAAPPAAGQAPADGQALAQAQAQGNVIRFTIPSLAPGQTRELQVIGQANQPGDVRLQVQMTSDQLTEPVIETEATRLF